MADLSFHALNVPDKSYSSLVKREIHRIVHENGFQGQKCAEVDIIVSELISNLVKHARHGGELLFRIAEEKGEKYFEIYAIDQGPGTDDIERYIKDGESSVNTLGQGLGAINRLSDNFDIYSMKGWGTIVYARKFMNRLKPFISKEALIARILQKRLAGEEVSGDGYSIIHGENEVRIFVGDGLGHGPHANEAVQLAIDIFKSSKSKNTTEILRLIHSKVKRTRGLVAMVVIMDLKEKVWRMTGVGNISTRIYLGQEYKSCISHNGTLGLNIPARMKECILELESYQTIIIYSDGIKNRWDLSTYTNILKNDPAIIAASIYKDQERNTDDATILVGKTRI